MSGILNTRIDIFTSRLLHLLSGSLLVGVSAVPLLYKSAEILYPKFFIIASGIVFLTGLYNVHCLQINKLKDAAILYRLVVYAGKIGFLALLSPILEKIVPASVDVHYVRFLIVTLAVATGTWLRYYREKHQKENAK